MFLAIVTCVLLDSRHYRRCDSWVDVVSFLASPLQARTSERLETYVWSYAWRYNNKTQMKEKLAKLAKKKEQKRLTRDMRGKKRTAKSCVLDEDIMCMFSVVEIRSNAHFVLGRMERPDACKIQHAR